VDVFGNGSFDRFVPLGRFCDDLEVGLGVEHHPEPSQDDRVVVGDEDAGLKWSRHAPRGRVGWSVSPRCHAPAQGRWRVALR
jgi:hypothetical protein